MPTGASRTSGSLRARPHRGEGALLGPRGLRDSGTTSVASPVLTRGGAQVEVLRLDRGSARPRPRLRGGGPPAVSRGTSGAGRTSRTLRTDSTGRTGRASRTSRTSRTSRAFRTSRTLRPSRATRGAGRAFRTGRTSGSLCATRDESEGVRSGPVDVQQDDRVPREEDEGISVNHGVTSGSPTPCVMFGDTRITP